MLVFIQAGMAQMVAHLIGSEEVTGSIPVASSLEKLDFTRKIKYEKEKTTEKSGLF